MVGAENNNQKKLSRWSLWFCAVYFFSYLARQNYNAVLTEIISDLGISKSLAGFAITGSFISYGVFQVVSGIIGDKYKPEKVIFIGLFGSSIINLLICAFPNIYFMNVLWCINGMFQSLIWPSLVRIILDVLGEERYSKAVVRVTQGSYGATILAYLIVPVLISFFNWRFVFLFFGTIVLIFSVLWLIKTRKIPHGSNLIIDKSAENNVKEKNDNKNVLSKKVLFQMGIIPILIATFIAGFMRDGISTWMPTYIKEVYNATSVTSILTGAILPFSCALCIEFLGKIGSKMKNELKAASLFYFVAVISTSVLAIFFSKYPICDVLLMAIITLSVHGVNLMLICNVPKRFSKFNKTSTLSGTLNAVLYAGASLSTFGTAYVATLFGWKVVVLLWLAVSVIAFALCFFVRKKYMNTVEEKSYKIYFLKN